MVYRFGSIQLPKANSLDVKVNNGFDKIKNEITLAAKFFERLAFYLTPEGKDYLRGVVQDQSTEWAGEGGLVNVKAHQYKERMDPLVAVRGGHWTYEEYLAWAQRKYKDGADPLEHIVEYIIDRIDYVLLDSNVGNETRLGVGVDLTPFIKVQLRASVPGDERFSRPGPNRIWTYQVKVPKTYNERYQANRGEFDPGHKWTEIAWAKTAISLPTLRVVELVGQARPNINDFTKGSLYAIDPSCNMYCFGTSKYHSALTNSAPVAAAGILVAEAGRVVAIDNRSGHYQPGFRQLLSAVKYLKANGVLEPDAFVSLYVAKDAAMYFSPEDFILLAEGGLRYVETAKKISEIAQKYGRRLPVPQRHAHLIPLKLADFPLCPRGDRWDLMLAKIYEPLTKIVEDLKGFLKSITGPTAWRPATPPQNAPEWNGNNAPTCDPK